MLIRTPSMPCDAVRTGNGFPVMSVAGMGKSIGSVVVQFSHPSDVFAGLRVKVDIPPPGQNTSAVQPLPAQPVPKSPFPRRLSSPVPMMKRISLNTAFAGAGDASCVISAGFGEPRPVHRSYPGTLVKPSLMTTPEGWPLISTAPGQPSAFDTPSAMSLKQAEYRSTAVPRVSPMSYNVGLMKPASPAPGSLWLISWLTSATNPAHSGAAALVPQNVPGRPPNTISMFCAAIATSG